jgi:hypothetical protein
MHRMIEITVPPELTMKIRPGLLDNPTVLGFSLLKGASEKPPGDVFQVHVLNSGADNVLRLVSKYCGEGNFSVVTSEVASISDPLHQKMINEDVDEAIWEEIETGIRHNGRVTANFLMLMTIAGIITAVGFLSDVQVQVIAFISASIIAPGLEPVTKVPLGIVLGKRDILWDGIKTTLAGYGLLMVAAAGIFSILLASGSAKPEEFLKDSLANALTDVTLKDLISSIAASAAGIIMYVSYRRNVIAGPLIALVTIPAASGAAMCLVLGEWNFALLMLYSLGVDFLLIIVVGVIIVWSKQRMVHKREPLR